MVQFRNFEHFISIEKEFKLKFSKIYTNSLFMPSELIKHIKKGKLFFEQTENLLQLFLDEGTYFRCYLYYNHNKFSLKYHGKPCVYEVIYKKGKANDSQVMLKNLLLNAGCKPHLVNRRMTYNLNNYILKDEQIKINDNIIKAAFADASHAKAIRDLWVNVLPPFNSDIPDVNDLVGEIKNSRIVSILIDGTLVASGKIKIVGRRASVWLISVDREYRRMRLGTLLLNKLINTAYNNGCLSVFLWVSENNYAAFESYKKYGFNEDVYISEEFILI